MPKRTNTSSSEDFSARLRFEMKKSGLSNVEILKLLSDELRKAGYWTKTADIKPQQLIKWLNGSNPSNDVKKGFEIIFDTPENFFIDEYLAHDIKFNQLKTLESTIDEFKRVAIDNFIELTIRAYGENEDENNRECANKQREKLIKLTEILKKYSRDNKIL